MFAYEKPEQKKVSKSTVQKKEAAKPNTSSNLTGIPDNMKTRFENLSGFSFDDVRVHITIRINLHNYKRWHIRKVIRCMSHQGRTSIWVMN